MKLSSIIGTIGTAGAVFKTASSLAVLVGAVYLVDCRLSSRDREACWMTALPIMGIGAAGRGGFSIGYETFNPALRQEDHKDQGLFNRRRDG